MSPPAGEETIFAEALRLAPEERAAYVARLTEGNGELRRRIEALLGSYEAGGFLEGAAAPELRGTIAASVPMTEKPGDTIGRYKLLQQIGEGGCGVVYMAEQNEPVRRRVALKIIKLGMDTKSVIARFEAERQALAMMDHPKIAKVFDAGATETGRPYFVMELVRGLKITDYCDEAKLSTRARLDLFIEVCQAIQHAHQKGIIHRDIKPSNILVTVNDGVAVPKVIDFGIAKATSGQQLTDKTLFTAFEQFIGTPAYMSPEQAVLTSLDIDTRSDIYALGVLLYELLTGKTPFDSKELLAIGLDEMRRTIREKEPQRPSTCVSTLPGQDLSTTAQRRGLEAPKLVSELRGDLDWIVMKALEKDRSRRYETANGLAMDVQRHLHNEPVIACPPSPGYRLQKLIRRNKLAFTAASAFFCSLLIGLSLSTWLFIKERASSHEQRRLKAEAQIKEKTARDEAAKSEQIASFLKEMLKGLGPSAAWGSDRALLQEVLKQTAERIAGTLTNQPELAISLRLNLAETYHELGLYESEVELAAKTLEFAQSRGGYENLLAADCLIELGWAEWRLNRLAEAEDHLRHGLAIRSKLLGKENVSTADARLKLSFVLCNQRRPAEGEAEAREALRVTRMILGNDYPEVPRALSALVNSLRFQRRAAEAEPYAREAVALYRKLLGNGHFETTLALNKLGMVLADRRQFGEAEQLMRETMATQRQLLGEKHPEVMLAVFQMIKILMSQDRSAEAEPFIREVEERGDAATLNNLAWYMGVSSESRLHDGRRAVILAEKAVAKRDPKNSNHLATLAATFAVIGEFEKAVNTQREAIGLCKDEIRKNDFLSRLKLYESKTAYRE